MLKKHCWLAAATGLALLALLAGGCSSQARKARYLARADQYFQAGKFEEASVEYMNVLRLEPLNPIAIRHLGLIYYDEGKLPQAVRFLSKAQELEPENLEVRLRLGQLYLSGGDLKRARTNSLFLLSKQPLHEEALLMLAEMSLTAEQLKEIQQRMQAVPEKQRDLPPREIEVKEIQLRLQKLQQQFGDKATLHLVAGTLALRQQDLKTAQAEFQRAVALDPKSATAQVALGNVHWFQNELEPAERAFKAAADLSPLKSPRRLRLIEFKIQTGAIEEAKKLLSEITQKAPQYVPAWTYLAQIAFSESKYAECENVIQKTLARDPTNYEVQILRARVRMVQGQPEAAITELERVNSQYPRVPSVLYQMAVAHLMKKPKDLAKATQSLNACLAANPNFVEATLLLAELNVRKGDITPAIGALTDLLAKRPKLAQAHLLLADAHRARGALEDAAGVYRGLMDLAPTNPQPPFLLGVIRRQQKKLPEARAAFEKAAQLAPNDLMIQDQLMGLEVAANQFGEALERANRLVEKDPKAPGPRLLQARVLMAQKDYAQAETVLQKVIELAPDARLAYVMLAELYVRTQRHQQAIEKFEGILAKNPKDTSALMQIAMIQSQQGEEAKAAKTYEKLIDVDKTFSPALNNLAYLYAEKLNKVEAAYDMARRARELLPKDPATADTLGWILYRRGEYARALTLLQEAASKLVAEPEVLYHLGMAHSMLGEEEPARTALQRALQLSPDFPARPQVEQRLALLNLNPQTIDPKLAPDLEKRLAEQPADPVVLVRLAALQERTGALDKAVSNYEKALKNAPDLATVLLRLAQLHAGPLKNPAKALEWAKSARKAAPEDVQVARLLGQLSAQAGDHRFALSLFEEAARKLPNDPGALSDLGMAYLNVGRLNDAAAAAQKAVQTGGTSPPAEAGRRVLSLIAWLNDPAKAVQAAAQVQETLKTNPRDVVALTVAGLIYQQQGNLASARQAFEAAYGANALFAPAIKQLAILHASNPTEPQKAYDLAVKAREAYPESPDVAKALALASYRRNDFARARTLLQEATRTLSKDAEAWYYLGLAYHQLRDKPNAKTALNQALSLNLDAKLAPEAKRVLAELK